MNVRIILLVVAGLAFTPFVNANEAGMAPAPHWEPPADANALPALGRAHHYVERMHERWLPAVELDWRVPRDFAVNMVCDLGLIALAIINCETLATTTIVPPEKPAGLLILAPAGGSGVPAPDFQDLRRRTIEERMNSI